MAIGTAGMKFSYSAVWNDASHRLKERGSLLLAVAGVFLLLPAILLGHFFPSPTGTGPDWLNAVMRHYGETWPWQVLASLVSIIGYIAIYRLVLDRNGVTVGSAIAAALPILPGYFLMTILTNITIGAGLLFFLIPGLYLIGRFAVSGAAMVAEGHRNPFTGIGRSWALTARRGWAVAGLVIIVFLAGFLLTFVITAVLGSIFLLVGGRDGVGGLLVLILNAALMSTLLAVMSVLFAAIYRALSGAAEPATTGI